ncbi:DUF1801 domain-containing protein [Pseudoluteimonas lycopersici]|uniref:DUF1801 domain-containing protein n=1 Tax=Pseudoluteimonas lycopersici TaxID=1324796 RepID=A0A516V3H2_9GAMM|nr:DUF1801 domain-containing protein [Lysobacter lycopersici]QDQ73066.1 DUF1801 domain-containing protein [Lysobacter lycopersici]
MKQPAKKATGKTAKKAASSPSGFSAAEKAAMKERARELKAEKGRAEGEADLLSKVAAMHESDRAMATRLHAMVKAAAPQLLPKTWYGMPAYANADGKVVCFFKDAKKFGDRYATFGFNDAAKLDDGAMWPTSFALLKLTAADEKKLAALVKQAAG